MYNLSQPAPILFIFCLSFLFQISFTLTFFFKVWFCTSQEAGETSESTPIYPNEWLPNSAHPWGTDTIPEPKEEERDRERERECIKEKRMIG